MLSSLVKDVDAASAEPSWFSRPLSGWWCALGWCLATGAFVGLVVLFGGIFAGDSFESTYSTWAVAHGHVSCMYPPHPRQVTTYAAPLYPLLSAGVAAITQIGHGTAFPSAAALGGHCQAAVHALNKWSLMAGVKDATLRLGFLSWLYLLVGLIWLLRASGRGRCGWEPTTAILVACLPPVWWCLEFFFHPQDLVAMGFALAAMACALRSQWVAAGILVALAVLTQQFALLVALPLLIVAPAGARARFVGAASATGLLVVGPLLALTSGSAARFIFLGSGDAVGRGGTLLWELQLNGAPLVVFSRIVPLALSLVLARFVAKRLGRAALQPTALIALVALSLTLRLVFEENMFGYYYMALAVCLVLLDVLQGRIRASLIAWLAMVTIAYSEGGLGFIMWWRQWWGVDASHWFPAVVMMIALLLVVRRVVQHRIGWDLLMWATLVVGALILWPVLSNPLRHQPVTWLWQAILVGIGIVLAGGPLRDLLRQHAEQPPLETAERTPSLQH